MNPVNNHSSANSILNIGMIHISTLNHWNTINKSLIHLYYSYLNLNENLFNLLQFETKQFKNIQLSINQYHLSIDNDDEQIDLSIINDNHDQIDLSMNNHEHNQMVWKNDNFFKKIKKF
ncbi:unnamed protein product [Schistosoma rodhaini]|nr:unnamed protein product [Schistosoma rodhaini]